MANPVVLRLQLTDVYGDPLRENVDVIFRHLEPSEIKRATLKQAQPNIGALPPQIQVKKKKSMFRAVTPRWPTINEFFDVQYTAVISLLIWSLSHVTKN